MGGIFHRGQNPLGMRYREIRYLGMWHDAMTEAERKAAQPNPIR